MEKRNGFTVFSAEDVPQVLAMLGVKALIQRKDLEPEVSQEDPNIIEAEYRVVSTGNSEPSNPVAQIPENLIKNG